MHDVKEYMRTHAGPITAGVFSIDVDGIGMTEKVIHSTYGGYVCMTLPLKAWTSIYETVLMLEASSAEVATVETETGFSVHKSVHTGKRPDGSEYEVMVFVVTKDNIPFAKDSISGFKLVNTLVKEQL